MATTNKVPESLPGNATVPTDVPSSLGQMLGQHWLAVIFWAVALGVATYLMVTSWSKIRHFLLEVREELKKCSWPTWQELRESTVVVAVSVLVLGLFVAYADFVFSNVAGGILYACGLRNEWLALKR